MKVSTLKLLDAWLRKLMLLLPKRSLNRTLAQPKSILVIKMSAMGDALCMMPAVRMLTSAFPLATIDWLTTERTNPNLFSNLVFINQILIVQLTPLGIVKAVISVGQIYNRYDLIIDFDQYYQVSEFIARRGKTSAGLNTPLKGESFTLKVDYQPHLNERYQFKELVGSVISNWTPSVSDYQPHLKEILHGYTCPPKLAEELEELNKLKKQLLIIYPGSSSNAKFRRWEWSRYVEVIKRFQDQCSIVIAGGEDEQELSDSLEDLRLPVRNWINRWLLIDWAWLFHQERPIFVGNDGGLVHIAEAMELPIIGIFGPSLFSKWGSVQKESVGIEAQVDCRPCLKNYLGQVPQQCWKGTNECLTSISPNVVIEEIEKKLIS